MFVRRRPLLRAAVVGGGAYIAGKRSAQRSDQQSMSQESPQQSTQPQSTQQQSTQQQVPQQGGDLGRESATPSVSDQLAQLSTLHKQGSLSDAEFATAKSKLLGS
jgi:hypothetical protein